LPPEKRSFVVYFIKTFASWTQSSDNCLFNQDVCMLVADF